MLSHNLRFWINQEQQKALAHFKAKIDSGTFGVTLLYGVTDSGKTELYIRSIEAGLQKGKSAIVLLPEIALTAQTVQRFSSRFERIAVMHSGLTAAQRNAHPTDRYISAANGNIVSNRYAYTTHGDAGTCTGRPRSEHYLHMQ